MKRTLWMILGLVLGAALCCCWGCHTIHGFAKDLDKVTTPYVD